MSTVTIFQKSIVFILMHCLDFPVMEYFTMKEFSTFGEVCNAEMDSGTVGNFSCFVIGMLYLFDSLYDRADM